MKTLPDDLLARVAFTLQEYLQEVGPCDHSVGLCACGLRDLVDEFNAAVRS